MNIDAVTADWLAERLPAGISVANFHGTLTGLLCAAGDRADELARLPRDLAKLLDRSAAELSAELNDFAGDAAAELDSPELTFDPWLPDDDVALQERLGALAEWCSAFVAAFERCEALLDDDSEEALADLAAMAELDVDDTADDEDEAEVDLIALTEHVRVAVLLLRAAAQAAQRDDDGAG
jgi:hypothetical protein